MARNAGNGSFWMNACLNGIDGGTFYKNSLNHPIIKIIQTDKKIIRKYILKFQGTR